MSSSPSMGKSIPAVCGITG